MKRPDSTASGGSVLTLGAGAVHSHAMDAIWKRSPSLQKKHKHLNATALDTSLSSWDIRAGVGASGPDEGTGSNGRIQRSPFDDDKSFVAPNCSGIVTVGLIVTIHLSSIELETQPGWKMKDHMHILYARLHVTVSVRLNVHMLKWVVYVGNHWLNC